MKLQPATKIAAEIIQALQPECIQIQEAGSVRRQMPEVKDIEIVFISKTSSMQMDLFGSVVQTFYHTDQVLLALIARSILTKDTVVKRWGSKYKRAVHHPSGIGIDLFRAEPDNWGYILALRTGPTDFNKILVTKRAHGGALPPDIKLQDGHVYHIGRCHQQTKIRTPTERGFFALLDLPFIPPRERTVKRLKRYIQERQNQ